MSGAANADDAGFELTMPSDCTPASALHKFVGRQARSGQIYADAIYDESTNDRFGTRSRKRAVRFKIAPSAQRHNIEWGGHHFQIWRTVEETVVGCGEQGPRKYDMTHVKTNAPRQVLESLLVDCFESQEESSTRKLVSLKVYNGAFWDSRGLLPRRGLETLFLPEEDINALYSQLEAFVQEKDQYYRFQIPYKKVLLLEGLPGAGKTSLAFTIASDFQRDLYLFPLTSETDDYALDNALKTIVPGSVLVLEDIDCLFEENGSSVKPKVTLTGLTNVLDGLSRIDDLWVVLTTNHVDHLPPVLLRSGRVDHKLHFDAIEPEEVARMVRAFFPETDHSQESVVALVEAIVGVIGNQQVTASTCLHFLFKHRTDNIEEISASVGEIAEKRERETWQSVYL